MASRENIYYWKCDRPSAFHAIEGNTGVVTESLKQEICVLLTHFFNSSDFVLSLGAGQGNHSTFIANYRQKNFFIRIENGPENDEYIEVEAEVMKKLQGFGIPTPRIYAVDSSRASFPFAYQIMECLECSDLNELYKGNLLDVMPVMKRLGQLIACWQKLTFDGFGPFNINLLREKSELIGLHKRYKDYFMLNLDKHLHFLVENHFFDKKQQKEIGDEVHKQEHLLDIERGCLVHKDMAFWNLMGTCNSIRSVIDWDDTISGDATDDLSLMACFHTENEINALIEGYQALNPLPLDFFPRFWLHLLRNMIVKSVIRVGAGYFNRSNNFFLLSPQYNNGADFHNFTIKRLMMALEGLKENKETISL